MSKPRSVSIWNSTVRDAEGNVKYASGPRPNQRMTSGVDWQALVMGGGAAIGTAAKGNSTAAVTATTFTLTGVGAPGSTTAYNGYIIVVSGVNAAYVAPVFGIILSNTNAAPPVVTVDRWYQPNTLSGAAGTTPATTNNSWVLVPGNAPLQYLALTATAVSVNVADTTLSGELSTNGFSRAFATYSHTASVASFALAYTFSCTGGSTTINTEAMFTAQNGSAGGDVMAFESVMPSPPTLINGDTLAVTSSVSFSVTPLSLLSLAMATTTAERVVAVAALAAPFAWKLARKLRKPSLRFA